MRLCELDPFVRFAAGITGPITDAAVRVRDCRIFFVEEGQMEIFIENKLCVLRKNSLFYCPGGSVYRIRTQGELKLICINFDLDRHNECDALPLAVCPQQEQWAELRICFQPVEDHRLLNDHLLVEDASRLQEQIRALVQEYSENTPLSSLLCGSLLKTVLLQLHRIPRQELPPKLLLVREYIREHYMQELTNSRIAEFAGYHEYYLNRLFRSHMGMNLHEYLVKVRLEQAVRMMRNTALPLSTIAEQVGMRSYPHFSACFKNHYGCSPAQFRSRHSLGI